MPGSMRRPATRALILGALSIFLLSACASAGSTAPRRAASAAAPTAIATRSASVQVPANAPRTEVSATCAPGETLIGGGFSASNTFEYDAMIVASYPASATTWTVAAGSSPAFTLTAEAYCVAIMPGGFAFPRRSLDATTRAACPPSMTLLGGGFQGGSSFDASRPDGNGWYAAMSAFTGEVYALCAERASGGATITATFNPHSSARGYQPGAARVTCPAGEVVVGGGFNGGLILTSASAGSPYTSWEVSAGGDSPVTVYARCVTLEPAMS